MYTMPTYDLILDPQSIIAKVLLDILPPLYLRIHVTTM